MIAEYIVSLFSLPGMGYVISSLIVVGLLLGALVKHAGWGIKDFYLWVVVSLVYGIGVQWLETQAGVHANVPTWKVATILAVSLVFYQVGVFAGVWIVKRERAKSREALREWEEVLETVKNGHGSNTKH